MHSILEFFKETEGDADLTPSKKYRKRMSRKTPTFDNCYIPDLSHPTPGSKEFRKDLEDVSYYFKNSCLNQNFLNGSDNSVEECFKTLCSEFSIEANWKKIKKLVDEVDTIVLRSKFQNMRPRPKTYLCDQSLYFESIKDSKTPAFPSGHTTIAYFIADILSELHPDYQCELNMMAELIGQSRIENGVHYPTDVSAGKFLGQHLASHFLESSEPLPKHSLKKKDFKNFARFLIKKTNNIEKSVASLADFIRRTNQIEGYTLQPHTCYNASKKLHQGYHVDYITDNPYIASTINQIVFAYSLKNINTIEKLITTHALFNAGCLENAVPGEIRNYFHCSPTGHGYVDHKLIHEELNNFFQKKFSNSFEKHAYFEHIHPFSDGNGRLGRILLCKDHNFDFDKTNILIDRDYINRINFLFDMID